MHRERRHRRQQHRAADTHNQLFSRQFSKFSGTGEDHLFRRSLRLRTQPLTLDSARAWRRRRRAPRRFFLSALGGFEHLAARAFEQVAHAERGACRKARQRGAGCLGRFTGVRGGFADSTAQGFGVCVVFVLLVVPRVYVRVGSDRAGGDLEALGCCFAVQRRYARLGRRVFAACEAQLHDQLRNARLRVDRDAHAVDLRMATPAVLQVFDLELAPDLEKFEIRADLDLLGAALTHPRLHRRAEPVDVQAHARTNLGLGIVDHRLFFRRRARGAVTQVAQRAHAARVERRELDAELAATAAFSAPSDLALDHDFSPAVLESTHERRAVFGQVRSAHVHSARAHIDGFGLEGRNSGLVATNLDQGFDPHATSALGATFLDIGHCCLQRDPDQGGQDFRVPSRVSRARTQGQVSLVGGFTPAPEFGAPAPNNADLDPGMDSRPAADPICAAHGPDGRGPLRGPQVSGDHHLRRSADRDRTG